MISLVLNVKVNISKAQVKWCHCVLNALMFSMITPKCDHTFENGYCKKCGWDGSESDYIQGLNSNIDN